MRRIALFLVLASILSTLVPAAAAAPATTVHVKVEAVARFFGSTCPFTDDLPESDTVCEDIIVLYFREAEPSTLRDAPWRLVVENNAVILHPDGEVTDLFSGVGVLEDPQGSFDLKTFATASVKGTVTLSDGREVDVDVAWDMSSVPLEHGGNDSLFNIEFGIDRHFADPCLTRIQLAHQQWRAGAPGQLTGTAAGLDVQDLYLMPNDPFIAGRSHFVYVDVEHGGCIPR